MSALSDIQREFAGALRNAELPPPQSVAGAAATPPVRRFNTHRNTLYAGIIGVLEARFPAVLRLLGEDFFRAMARIYADQDPPRSPVLLAYGATFSDFIAGFEPAADVPYLEDVARLEWEVHRSYHAADAAPVAASELAVIPSAGLDALRLTLAPHAGLISSPYPVFSIWRANARAEADGCLPQGLGGEDMLVSRSQLEVEVTRLPPGGHAFAQALSEGCTLPEAAEAAGRAAPGFPLDICLALLLQQGAFSAFSLTPRTLTETRP